MDPNNPQSWNRYAYVGNTPLSATDPLGLDCYPGPRGEVCNVTAPAPDDIDLDIWYWELFPSGAAAMGPAGPPALRSHPVLNASAPNCGAAGAPLVALDTQVLYKINPHFGSQFLPYFSPPVAAALASAIEQANEKGITPVLDLGFRTVALNHTVGGVPDSLHMAGDAVDISIVLEQRQFPTIAAALRASGLSSGAQFRHPGPEPWHFYMAPPGSRAAAISRAQSYYAHCIAQ